ncbi:hypothetical protein Hypma_004709 [Hypsizygus marmoreus]|uniref:Uncharacterized protein n=1 Tax=Hypsizygus marmoreus TaxID=39966 RepID=A0A369J1E5_HYPMA|nr:hypothetical protein Hypma_004709 [Hypsizygus marmoreus]
MAPLAGKPPYATDEPDTFYESSPAPQRRVRQQPPPDPNSRSSAYDMYNNYLNDDDDKAASRQSGVGALGLGLLNMDDSDSDSDDDDTYSRRKPAPASPASKHAALAAATSSPSRPSKTPSPSPQSKHQPHIAAPQPGYAAPIAALNLARPDPIAVPQGRTPPTLQTQGIQNPFESPFETPSSSPTSLHGHRSPAPPYHISTSPSPSMVSSEPHPLQPPITPITPVFARPAKTGGGVKFTDSDSASTPIMRGDKEETLLPSRGQRGDDFWRRFSMVVKEENKKPSTQKESSWLKKTRGGTMRLSRWVWIIGVILLLCIGAAIGIGWYASHKAPDHQQPTAFGGSANEAAVTTSSAGVKPSVLPNGATSSIKHVSPTHTVARRAPQGTVRAVHKKRRLH